MANSAEHERRSHSDDQRSSCSSAIDTQPIAPRIAGPVLRFLSGCSFGLGYTIVVVAACRRILGAFPSPSIGRDSGVGREARNLDSPLRVTRQSPGWLPPVEWFVLAALAVTFIGHSFVPAWRTLKSEFPNYYLAAELYHKGIPLDRVYEWTWFQRQNDHWGVRDGLVSFAPNPPTLIFSLMPFTRLQPLAAKRCWLVLSLISLAVALWTLRRVTVLGWRRLILIALLCVLPLSDDFLFARHYVFILFLVCAAYYAARL